MSQENIIASNEASSRSVLSDKLTDILTPGYEAEFDPDEAELAGAFREDALSAGDAAESSLDAVDPSAPVADRKAGA